MRLIHTRTLEFHDFLSEIPPYGILSHTWSDGEVSFQDMSSQDRSSKKGYTKITQTCRLAIEHGLDFAWIDTCCIDKSSSAELTESINSMFQWYRKAEACFVFLEDLLPNSPTEESLVKCRWFTRGWTLQEMIAPKSVEFYDSEWTYRGSKLYFIDTISTTTGIPRNILLGNKPLAACSVANRMSWAANRETTRTEDIGYCLLGIFDVNMPMIYGEGLKAFRRLQEEIVKCSNDLTIFAWDVSDKDEQRFTGLFAASPAAFVNSSRIWPFSDDNIDFSVSNKGLLVSGDAPMRTAAMIKDDGRHSMRYLLCLGRSRGYDGGICLRKVGPNLFYRDGRFPLAGFGANFVDQRQILEASDYYIVTERRDRFTSHTVSAATFRNLAIHIPFDAAFELERVAPESLWDITDRIFLRPKPYSWTRYPMVLAAVFRCELAGGFTFIDVLFDHREQVPICKVFRKGQYPRQEAMIFQPLNGHKTLNWIEVEIEAPEILLLTNSLQIRVGSKTFEISVTFEKGIVNNIAGGVDLFSMKFNISTHL